MRVRGKRGFWRVGALALLLAGCASNGAGTVSGARSTPALTPTATSGAEPSPASLSSLGWKQVSGPLADAIALAPSAPNTVYTCSGASSVIQVNVSSDGGASWRTMNTPAQAGLCGLLRVSPTDPQAVAFLAVTCREECGASEEMLYYTLDAGAHWQQALSTSDAPANAFGWVGTTLFVNAAPADTSPAQTQNLAASVNGGAFTWTNFPLPVNGIFSDASTLYVLAGSSGACSAPTGGCDDLYRSTDLGASWTHLTPIYNGANIGVEAFAPGAATFLGYDVRAFAGPGAYPMLRSTDGGATWKPLPSFAAGMLAATDGLIAPDGAVYVFAFSDGTTQPQSGIYRLAPGASSWALVSPVYPANLHLVMVSWGADGHPALLWGLVEANDGSSVTALWTHTA